MNEKLGGTKKDEERLPRMARQNANTVYDRSMKTLMDTNETATFLKTTRATIWSMVQKREIPFTRISRKLYFFKEDLIEFLESKTVAPSKGPAADGGRR